MPGTRWDKKMNRHGCCPTVSYNIVEGIYQPLTKHNRRNLEKDRNMSKTLSVYKELCDYSFEDIHKRGDTKDNLKQN